MTTSIDTDLPFQIQEKNLVVPFVVRFQYYYKSVQLAKINLMDIKRKFAHCLHKNTPICTPLCMARLVGYI